jgi:hypothetical protein
MEIYMDKFFPCEQARFKKLLKIISLDWAHEEELKEELKVYFQNRIPNLPKEAEAKKREAAEYKRKAAEAKKALNAEKKRIRSGGDPPYLEFRYDSEYRNNKYLAQEAEREAKKLLKSKQSFEKYLESM